MFSQLFFDCHNNNSYRICIFIFDLLICHSLSTFVILFRLNAPEIFFLCPSPHWAKWNNHSYPHVSLSSVRCIKSRNGGQSNFLRCQFNSSNFFCIWVCILLFSCHDKHKTGSFLKSIISLINDASHNNKYSADSNASKYLWVYREIKWNKVKKYNTIQTKICTCISSTKCNMSHPFPGIRSK